MGIVTTIDANVKEPGEVVLNAKLLSSMVSRMPSGQINIQSAETENHHPERCGTVRDPVYEPH